MGKADSRRISSNKSKVCVDVSASVEPVPSIILSRTAQSFCVCPGALWPHYCRSHRNDLDSQIMFSFAILCTSYNFGLCFTLPYLKTKYYLKSQTARAWTTWKHTSANYICQHEQQLRQLQATGLVTAAPAACAARQNCRNEQPTLSRLLIFS